MQNKSIIVLMLFLFGSCNAQKPGSKMNEIESILNKQIKKHGTPSVHYVIFNKDNIIYQFMNGFADIRNQKKTDDNTRYNAFSITKTFTALAVLRLEEQGKLNINKPIREYLPDFPYSHEITIKQVLSHAAGIPNPIPLSWIHSLEEHQSFNTNVFFKQILQKNNKTKAKPNEKFAYSNLGYVILGQLIEKVSGQKYEDYMLEHLIKSLPIHTADLSFEIGDTGRYAKGYHKKNSFSGALLGLFIDKSKFMGKPEGKWRPFKFNYVNGASYGGLIGTPNAFVSYIQELLKPDSKLISGRCKKLMFTENITNTGKTTGMCLAWFKGKLNGYTYFTHAGGGGGYYCEIRIYPELNLGSIIMFNRTGMKDDRFLNQLDKYILPPVQQ